MRMKYKGVALVGTVAAMIAWILLSYGIFTVQSSQFQMFVASRDAVNAQKLAEVDASLIKMIGYDDVTNDSALKELNLHLGRENMQTVTVDGNWQDEIIISEEKANSGDSDYGNFRIATINIYKSGDTEPRYSKQVPILKSGQTYSKKAIDDFMTELKAKDKKLEEKDKQLEAKDRELEAKDKQLEAKDRELDAKDRELESLIESLRSECYAAIEAARCLCSSGISGS